MKRLLALSLSLLLTPVAFGAIGSQPLSGGGGIESEASTYFTRAGVTNDLAKTRLNGFVATLKRYNLWNSMLDGATYRASQQPSGTTNYLTFKGLLTQRSAQAVTLDENGALFTGSQVIAYSYPDLKPFSLAYTVSPTTNDIAGNMTMIGLDHAVGTFPNPRFDCLYENPSSEYANVYITANGGNVALTTAALPNQFAPGAHKQDPVPRTLIWGYSTNSAGLIKLYVNGCLNSSNSLVGGALTGTNVLSSLVIGGTQLTASTYTPEFTGYIPAWAIFDHMLTDAEARQVTEAFRWLDPHLVNWVMEGDSYTDTSVNFFNEGWPSYLSQFGAVSNKAAFFNMARSGEWTSNWTGYYDTQLYPRRPGIGGVSSSVLFLQGASVNDFVGGSSTLTIATNVAALAARARADGFEVRTWTLMYNTFINDSNRAQINSHLLTNRENFDVIYRRDLLQGITNTTDFDGNADHPSPEGNRTFAQLIWNTEDGGALRGHTFSDYNTWTNVGTAETTLGGVWILGGDLRQPLDAVRFEAAGTTAANANNKTLRVRWGTETIFDTGLMALNAGTWKIRGSVTAMSPTTQRCEVDWIANATLVTSLRVTNATQNNLLYNFLRLTGTSATAAFDITNNFFRATLNQATE